MQLEREGGGPDGIFRMPVLFGVDDSDSEEEMVAIGAGQFRRKSTAREESELLEGDGFDTDSMQGETNGHAGSKRRRGE
jgi:COMPASS component SWD1